MWSGTGGHVRVSAAALSYLMRCSNQAPEGPHVYLKDGWYYMLLAEGECKLNSPSITADFQHRRNGIHPYGKAISPGEVRS